MPRHATNTSFKSGKEHVNWKGGIDNLNNLAKSTVETYCRKKANKIMNCPKEYVVHHIDGDVTNNNKNNLQIMTQSEHCTLHNKQRLGSKQYHRIRYKIAEKVKNLTKKGFSSRKIAKILNVSKNTVLRARRV